MKNKNNKIEKILLYGLLIFSLLVCGYVLWQMMTAATPKAKSSKGFLLFEMLIGVATIFVPQVFTKISKIQIPTFQKSFYWFFIWMAVFVGTGLGVISKISFWDKLLHLGSAMMLTAIGYGLLGYFLDGKLSKPVKPIFYLLFGFAFAMMCGVLWEFWEFSCDSILGMNLQRFRTSGGVDLIGRAALMDTMGDLWTNAGGAFLFSVIVGVISRRNKTFWENLAFYKK